MYNKQKTLELANKIKSALTADSKLGLTDTDVAFHTESDGSIEIEILKGKIVTSGIEGATAKNISAAIDSFYNEQRRLGNLFSQPVSGSFSIGVKENLSEAFSFKTFLSNQEKQ